MAYDIYASTVVHPRKFVEKKYVQENPKIISWILKESLTLKKYKAHYKLVQGQARYS